MENKELVLIWIGTLISSGIHTLSNILSVITYSITISFTLLKMHQHIKENRNGKSH